MGGEERAKALPRGGIAEIRTAGDMNFETMACQPSQPFDRNGEAAGAAFLVMKCRIEMVEADAQGQPIAVILAQAHQARLALAHGLHGVGQHQGTQAAGQHRLQHWDQVAVHEGLTAGKAHLLQWFAPFSGLV